jgi:hypothetical protein
MTLKAEASFPHRFKILYGYFVSLGPASQKMEKQNIKKKLLLGGIFVAPWIHSIPGVVWMVAYNRGVKSLYSDFCGELYFDTSYRLLLDFAVLRAISVAIWHKSQLHRKIAKQVLMSWLLSALFFFCLSSFLR